MYSYVKLVCQHEAIVQTFTANDPALTFMLTGTQDLPPPLPSRKNSKPYCVQAGCSFDIQAVCEVSTRRAPFPQFPVFTANIGALDRKAPAVGFFGGIHGLERIGTQVILHYMRALLFRLEWDELLRQQLEKVRLIFMPIVNPGGMWGHKRANPNGVDLMRNAPQRAESSVPFLAGGQTLTPLLPWYCGQPGAPMQTKSAALLSVVSEQLYPALQPSCAAAASPQLADAGLHRTALGRARASRIG